MERVFGGIAGLAWIALALSAAAAQVSDSLAVGPDSVGTPNQSVEVRLLALGDVSLGREVGQRILRGDTLWPFRNVLAEFRAHDIVFANLESNLSNQGGETQHPDNNLIFTGPPQGAWTLRQAGVTVVSTANNHALDYGRAAKDSTIRYLEQAGILFSGTSKDRERLYDPAIVERNGLRFAFFSVTAIMNIPGEWWKGHVAFADTSRLLPKIRAWRPLVDVIVVSYHGGDEYSDRPGRGVKAFAKAVLVNGCDLFLGHHPHVPYGLVKAGKGLAAHSLGNFVFNQPQRFWTQRSFGLSVTFARQGERPRIASWRVLPLRAGNQPAFLAAGADADTILARVRALSDKGILDTASWQ